MNKKETEIKEAKDFIKPKSKIIINITKVSSSGMSKRMKVYYINDNDLINITYYIGLLCGLSRNDNGLLVTGCGMDMAFWLAKTISYDLFEKGKTKEEIEKIKKQYKGNGGSCIDRQVL